MLRICVLVLASLLNASTAAVVPGLSIPCAQSDVSCIFQYVSSSDAARSLYRTGSPAGEGVPSIPTVDPLVLSNLTIKLPTYNYETIVHEITIEGLSTADTVHLESKSVGEEKIKAKVTQIVTLKLRGHATHVYKNGPTGDIFLVSDFEAVYTNMTVETTFPLTFVTGTSGTFVQLGQSSSEVILPLKQDVHLIDTEEGKQMIKLKTKEEVDYLAAIQKRFADDGEDSRKAWTQLLVDVMYDRLFQNYANFLKRAPLKQ